MNIFQKHLPIIFLLLIPALLFSKIKTYASNRGEKVLFNVLVFSKTNDIRHESIEEGKLALVNLGKRNSFVVDTTEDASAFTLKNLKKYRVVVFLNNDGELLDKKQKAAFEKYIKSGGAFVGIHGASAAQYEWKWYGDLLGAFFDKHPKIQQATIRVVDKNHPSTIALPEEWVRTDEWYNFRSNPKDLVNVVLTIDESTYTGGTHGEVHPMSWYHTFNGARRGILLLDIPKKAIQILIF